LTKEVSPLLCEHQNEEEKPGPSTNYQKNFLQKEEGSNCRSKSSIIFDNVSLHSISSSSTNLSSPPRAFPKISKIVPEKKISYEIKFKKSRWEPISSSEEKRRFDEFKKSKKEDKKMKKKKTKGKKSKELVNESHRTEGLILEKI
jgi:hypothetical protein